MNVFIVGGTGTLGRQIVRRALDEGHQVHCLVRSPAKATFLREWGATLLQGNLCYPESIVDALKYCGASVIIDAATTRPTDTLTIEAVDWQGKVNLIQAAQAADIQHFIFFSIMGAQDYPHVPLMQIKQCTEDFLRESGLNYTILRPSGFFQGIIGQYAIPILENHSIWVMGESTAIAYMDTQDVAKFAVRCLDRAATYGQAFDLAGPEAWTADQIIKLCENLSGQEAKITRLPIGVLRATRQLTQWFQWTWNISDRLAFTEVIASGMSLNAPMEEVYRVFDLDPTETLTLEAYLQEYFTRILRKLKELDYEKVKQKKASRKRSPFKSTP
ncbi:SDR family oxidoreductase [Synechococcus sp. PCC 6717]|jgi:uncharacterized protein YbjT (DUF2867 family)|nr:SDR family oxidoreductase [Synechococcus sp. PCC 6717]